MLHVHSSHLISCSAYVYVKIRWNKVVLNFEIMNFGDVFMFLGMVMRQAAAFWAH